MWLASRWLMRRSSTERSVFRLASPLFLQAMIGRQPLADSLSPISPRRFQHSGCFLACGFAARFAAQHARQFFKALRFLQQLNLRDGAFAAARFADGPVMARVAGHLRQVRHANNLMRLTQSGELLSENVTEPAAHIGVD